MPGTARAQSRGAGLHGRPRDLPLRARVPGLPLATGLAAGSITGAGVPAGPAGLAVRP